MAFFRRSRQTTSPTSEPPINIGAPAPISPIRAGGGFFGRRGKVGAPLTGGVIQGGGPNIGAPVTGSPIRSGARRGFFGRGRVFGTPTPGTPIQGIGRPDLGGRLLGGRPRRGPGGVLLQPGQTVRDGRVFNADGSSAAVAATPAQEIQGAIAGRKAKTVGGGRDVGFIQAREAVIRPGTPGLEAIAGTPPPPRVPFKRPTRRPLQDQQGGGFFPPVDQGLQDHQGGGFSDLGEFGRLETDPLSGRD